MYQRGLPAVLHERNHEGATSQVINNRGPAFRHRSSESEDLERPNCVCGFSALPTFNFARLVEVAHNGVGGEPFLFKAN